MRQIASQTRVTKKAMHLRQHTRDLDNCHEGGSLALNNLQKEITQLKVIRFFCQNHSKLFRRRFCCCVERSALPKSTMEYILL